jgi:hypothetical protein
MDTAHNENCLLRKLSLAICIGRQQVTQNEGEATAAEVSATVAR